MVACIYSSICAGGYKGIAVRWPEQKCDRPYLKKKTNDKKRAGGMA
jgi:hypothetical protein